MSRPSRALIWMGAFLLGVLALAALAGTRLIEIFLANPFFNGVIVLVLIAGIIVNVRQMVVLSSEVSWIESFRRSNPERGTIGQPVLLAPM
ncbi:MAG: flagellar motor protein MotA, partial [Dokdonella sp.]